MYKHETKNPNPELVDYECPVCEQNKTHIITNFRVDLHKGNNICILSNDLLTDRICPECLMKEIASWNAIN